MDTLNTDAKASNSGAVVPSSEYTLTEITPENVNNLPANVVKMYDSENLAHYYEVEFKNSVYGEGDLVKYFKWGNNSLVETSNEAEAVITIRYSEGETLNKYIAGDGQTIESVSELFVDKNIKGVIGGVGNVGNVSSKFVGNSMTITGADDYTYSTIYTGIGGAIDSVTSSFIGNQITIDAAGNRIQGPLVKVLGDGTITTLNSEFVGNNVVANTRIDGGLVNIASDGVIGSVTSDFIKNSTQSSAEVRGGVFYAEGTANITSSKFLSNDAVAVTNAWGGALFNGATGGDKLTISDSVFVDNRVRNGSTSYGGAIYNAGALTVTNTSFRDNYASGSDAKGGAIYSTLDMTISANAGKTTEFTGNYTLNGSNRKNEAIYVDNSNATLTLSATDGGHILFNDIINGKSGYNVVLGGDTTGTISIYNGITNANVRANGTNIDLSDGNFFNYDFLSLASDNTANFSLDVDFLNNKADKFTLGAESRGTIYINDLNLIGGAPTVSKTIQLLTGPDTISIGLSEDLINQYHKITIRDRGESDDLTASAKWGDEFGAHLYKDTIEEGIRTVVTGSGRVNADSLEYYVNTTTEDLGVVAAGDTMMLLNQSDKFAEKTFTAKSASDSYTVGANLGKTSGTFTVSGYNSNGKNTLDADGHTLFEVGDGARVNLNYLTINNLADTDGSLLNIAEGGSAKLSYVNVNGNEGSAAILNDGALTLSGGTSSAHNTITGGGIKGSGTTTIDSSSYWDFAPEQLQTTVNNGELYLSEGTLSTAIKGLGTVYLNGDVLLNNEVALTSTSGIRFNKAGIHLTTNADHLKSVITQENAKSGDASSLVTLTGGTLTKNITGYLYSSSNPGYKNWLDIAITGDVNIADGAKMTFGKLDIAEGASLTTSAGSLSPYFYNNSYYQTSTNNGTLNLTGGSLSLWKLTGTGTMNIDGEVSMTSSYSNSTISQDTLHVKDGATLHAYGDRFGAITNFVNDSVLDLTGGTIGQNTVTAINGKGKTLVTGFTTAYYTDFNQDLEVKSGSLNATWDKIHSENIVVDGTLGLGTDKTSSSVHGKWIHDVSGTGTTNFYGYNSSNRMYIDNEAKIGTKLSLGSYTYLWSNADLLGGDINIGSSDSNLYLTGGTLDHQATFNSGYLYIDTGANVVSNALLTSTNTGTRLYLNDNSTLTISADNLDANASLATGSNLKLTSGTWDNTTSGYGTVTILSGNEVQHDTMGGTGKSVSSAVMVEDGAKFTASASNLKGSVTNEGELYLSGVLNRKYSGTGTTFIDDTLHVANGAGFPATFDLNNGTLISDSIATYTFGHTTNNGDLIFNINASSDAHDLFNLASTSDAVFDIQDVVFGTYKSPTFANTVKTYQILKGSPSYLTLGENIHKDIEIYDSYRDQLGVNIYQDDPENRYFDDKYVTHHTSGTVAADIELATTDNNHDSVKVTYGDYVGEQYETRLDLLSDWNTYSTTKERNFNFRTADDVYTSIQNVGATAYKSGDGAILNINGVSETSSDEEGNTVIKRSVIDLSGFSGIDMSNSANKNVMNISNVEFRNGKDFVIKAQGDTFGSIAEDGTTQGGIVNTLFKNNTGTTSRYGAFQILSQYTIVHQILNSTFEGNTSSPSNNNSYSGALYNNGTISGILNSTFEENSSSSKSSYSYSGALYNGGMISEILNSTFEGNSSSSSSGASSSPSGSFSGALYNNGTISEIVNSTFERNSSSANYSSYSGALYNSGAIIEILNSTFKGNTSSSVRSSYAAASYSGALYNSGTISKISNSTFEGNSSSAQSSSYSGALYNSGTISEILNSTFEGNSSSSSSSSSYYYSYSGALYNSGSIKISARDIVDENGNITKGLTKFSDNYVIKGSTKNNIGIYNHTTTSSKTAVMTLEATNNGVIQMDDKIVNGKSSTEYAYPTLNLTGDATGTIKLHNAVEGGNIFADTVNINTANDEAQAYTFTRFTSDATAKWTIDANFATKNADTFTVGAGTGTMYIDNLNVIGSADEYTKVRVLNKSADDTTVLELNGAVVDIRDTLGDTVYNNDSYHQDAGYAVSSSWYWDATDNADKFGIKDSISQCIDEDLDTLNLIASSNKNEVRNFIFRDGSTYTVTQDLDQVYQGTLNIKGVEGDTITSTIDANGHKLFENNNASNSVTLNISDAHITGTDDVFSMYAVLKTGQKVINLSNAIIDGNIRNLHTGSAMNDDYFVKVNIDGSETILNGNLLSNVKATLNEGSLRINTDTFKDNRTSLTINEGTLALNNGSTETYNIYKMTPGDSGKLALDIDLNAKTSDQISTTSSSGVITVSAIDFINGIPDNTEFVVQVIKNNSKSTSLQLALDESIKHYVFQEYSDVLADEIQIDTDFGHTYYNRLYTGTAHGDLSLATTDKTNDSIAVKIEAAWNDNPEIVDSMGDTLNLIATSDLSTRNFNSKNSKDVYNVSADLDKTAAGTLNLNGTLDETGNRSTINFKNHNAFTIGNDTNLNVNNIRLTGSRDIITVDSSNTDIILNNAFVNGNILGNQKYDLRIDGTETTTILGKVTNADVVFANGGLVIAEKTFADDSVSLTVNENAYVHLNDGDISNYEFAHINSSNSSKFGLDLDLETRQADMITAEGEGRIVFEKFDIVNRNLSNVDIGEDYTIRILQTSNDSLQLAISETVQMQLAKEYKLGTVHEIIQMDEVQAVANWGDKWKVVEGDYDVYGKLKLATTVTTNDSLHLYELRKELGQTSTNLGDTLMLVSILETDSDRRFWTDSATDRYTLTTDIDVVSSGKMTIDGATDGNSLSTIDMDAHKGFKLSNETEMTVNNVEFVNAGYKDGSLFNLTNEESVLNLNNVTITETTSTNAIKNNATVNFTGGTNTLYSGISGNGVTNIGGDNVSILNLTEGLSITQDAINVNANGRLNVAEDSYLYGALTNSGNVDLANANALTLSALNDGSITIKSGTLLQDVTGEGQVNISDGSVQNKALIDQDVNVAQNAEFTTNADNIGGVISNAGVLNLTGSLKNVVKLDGTTNVDKTLTLAAGAGIDGTLNLNDGAISTTDGKTTDYNIGTMLNYGTFDIDLDLTNKKSDKFIVGNDSEGTVYIDEIAFSGTLGENESFKVQVLDTHGTDAIQLALNEELTKAPFVVGTVKKGDNDLRATVDFDEKFHDNLATGTVYAELKLATTATTNDSIELKYTETIWGDFERTERLDTLKELAQYDTDEDKNFNFKTSNDKYTVAENLGEAADGILNINGVANGDKKSEIDLNDHSGFELTNDTTLNLTDVKIGGGKDDKLIVATNSDAVINIENGTLNGDIDGTGTSININGDDTDTTVLNGTITDSDSTLNGGTLKFNTDTFGDSQDTLTVNNGRVDVQDSKVDTYDINKLTSSENGKYSIDIDLSNQTSDKFNLTDTTSSGTVYIDDINYINGELPEEFTVQVLDTKGNNDIQIKLSDEIKNKVYDFGKVEENWNDLKADVDFDELFHDFHKEGEIKGSIKEATTNTTNDSITLKKDAPIWGDIESAERLDTLHEISAYETDKDKTFNFKTANDDYVSKADAGVVNGTLTVNGVSDSERKSEIDLSGYGGFELTENTVLNIHDVDIDHAKSNDLITAQAPNAVVNVENVTMGGNIQGDNTQINISGDTTDTTVFNGVITDSDTTLNGGTLKFNTDTFGDSQDTLAVNNGRVDVKNSKVDTYDVNKLTSSENGKYSIDVDLSKETADKFNLTDTTSSGTVYIDDINYLNGDISKEFIAQVLDTKGNDKIQIQLSDSIKSQKYDLGTTEENWNDLKADVDFDELFHDFHRDGVIKGSIKEATTNTTNDSIALSVDDTSWGKTQSIDRIDTLHEISAYEVNTDKTFNFKTSKDEYISKADVGELNGTLSVNGVADSENKSQIDLNNHSGFEMNSDSVLNLSDVEFSNAKNDNSIVAREADAVVNIENVTMNGNILGKDTAINITGSNTDTTILNGRITDSDTSLDGGTLKFNTNTFADNNDTLDVISGRVDVQDSKVDTYDINKLTSSENGKYSIDLDLTNQTSDKFNLADTTSSGTVYIDDINYINGELPTEFTTQVLDTKGNSNIQIKLSDDIKNKVYDFGKVEENWNDLKADVDFDELFHDFHKEGEVKGSIKEATTNTTNDSISLKMDAPIWGKTQSTDRIDTLHEISAYETDKDKTFNFKTSSDEFKSKTDVGIVDGTLTVKGVSDGENRSSIDLTNHNGFELNSDTTLNLNDVQVSNGKGDNLIIAKAPDAVVNVENTVFDGNVSGDNTQIHITGDNTDTTIINGTITDGDTTLDGGTLQFNTDTFADKDDTLTVNQGRVDVQDSKVDTYDVNKLTSSENGKYSIDVDLSNETSDKFNLTDTTSSGTVYIDDINYINGELPTEFTTQILDTKGNDKIQIKLSDEIKNKIYDFGKTEKNWNDLKADVDFDEFFHDFHQEGEIKGSIKEATTNTTNDSISLKMDAPIWGDIESAERLDTLHEISDYVVEADKTFNFKTGEDEYNSKANVGELHGTLSINGVKDGDKLSKIDLDEHKGFELVKDSKLNINSTRISNGAENTLITATDESAELTLNNSQVDGVITGVDGYKVKITGNNEHIFDVRNNIENAKINIDSVQMDMYDAKAFSSSNVVMTSGILNLTADRQIADLASKTFEIGGSFNILADADLHKQVMDKLPSNTTIVDGATLNVAGINLLSDTTESSVAIPFAYKAFKDNVEYKGSSTLSKETQITTAYAPIYKYDIRYDNRDDMGYFVFSRHGANGGNGTPGINPSDSYNPAVLASPVATQAAGQSAMNETFRYVFEHADAFTQLPAIDRLSAIKSNQTALSTDFNHNLGSLCTEHNNKAGWFRPYTTFETINLQNGPKVSTINYGSLVGFDTDFHNLKHGWHNVGTGYIGYNGSQLHYTGVDTTMNGGVIGLTETFYKGNFWTAITASAGAGVAETRSMYGKEDSTMFMAGLGSKTGYNFEFKEGKYIVQPIMFMSYTFVNTLDYTNAAGVRIKNDPMHTVQINPSMRFIANLNNGWQPYASVGMVWNLMNESSSSANGVKLPEMHTKPYIEYGVGIQKNIKDHFTAFGQAMLRNGGRNGIALTAGFRWAIGHEHHEHSQQEQVNNPQRNERKVLKQLPVSQKTVRNSGKDTTITLDNPVIKKIN